MALDSKLDEHGLAFSAWQSSFVEAASNELWLDSSYDAEVVGSECVGERFYPSVLSSEACKLEGMQQEEPGARSSDLPATPLEQALLHGAERLINISRGVAVTGHVFAKILEASPQLKNALKLALTPQVEVVETVASNVEELDQMFLNEAPYNMGIHDISDVSKRDKSKADPAHLAVECIYFALNDCDAGVLTQKHQILDQSFVSVLPTVAAAFANEKDADQLAYCMKVFYDFVVRELPVARTLVSDSKVADSSECKRFVTLYQQLIDILTSPTYSRVNVPVGVYDMLGIALTFCGEHAAAVKAFANEVLLQQVSDADVSTKVGAEIKFVNRASRALTLSRASLSLLNIGEVRAARGLMHRAIDYIGRVRSPRLLRNLAVIEFHAALLSPAADLSTSNGAFKTSPVDIMQKAIDAQEISDEKPRMLRELEQMKRSLAHRGVRESDVGKLLQQQNFTFDADNDSLVYSDDLLF